MTREHERTAGDVPAVPRPGPLARLAWQGLALTCVGLGSAGAVLPLVPTTPFLLVAAFAAARGSPSLHALALRPPALRAPAARLARPPRAAPARQAHGARAAGRELQDGDVAEHRAPRRAHCGHRRHGGGRRVPGHAADGPARVACRGARPPAAVGASLRLASRAWSHRAAVFGAGGRILRCEPARYGWPRARRG
ncbi:MAG: DUF454 family protein [Halofilum sp. (in: g-proteobacteria)]|nr:DUF454 family protein [Halofilum sp. (in: g-proteobacteria)]